MLRAVKKHEGQEVAAMLRTSPHVQNALLENDLRETKEALVHTQQATDVALWQQSEGWKVRAGSVAVGGIIGTGVGYALGNFAHDKVTAYMTESPKLAKFVVPVVGAALGGVTYGLSTPDEPDTLPVSATFYGLAAGLFIGSAVPAVQSAVAEAQAASAAA